MKHSSNQNDSAQHFHAKVRKILNRKKPLSLSEKDTCTHVRVTTLNNINKGIKSYSSPYSEPLRTAAWQVTMLEAYEPNLDEFYEDEEINFLATQQAA